MLTEPSPQANTSNSLQAYDSLSRNGSPDLARATSVRRVRQGLGIKALMQTLDSTDIIPTPKKVPSSQQTTTSTTITPFATTGFSDKRETPKPKQRSLRDKRLQDIQTYKTYCDKSAGSPRAETAYNFKPNLTTSMIKSPSSGVRMVSTSSSLRKRRNLRISQINTYENLSGAFSLDGFSREHDSASRISTTNTSPTFQGNTPTQKNTNPSIRIHTDFVDESPRGSPGTRMIELKLLADSVDPQAVPPEGRTPTLRQGVSTSCLKKRGMERFSPKATETSEQNNFSSSSYSYGFNGMGLSLNNSPILGGMKRASPTEESKISPEEWKEYSQKAQDKMPKLKLKIKKRDKITIPENLNNEDTKKMLQTIKPIYSEFITQKFDESIVNRMNTFNAFGFTRDEKSDNQEIKMFFNDINRGRDITGTMCMVDLWSIQQRKDVAQKAKFAQEKHMLEKFAFYTSEQQKRLVPTKGQSSKPPKVSGGLDKHKYAMMELTKSADKNQRYALMSPMQRHLELRGKGFHEPKEATIEAQEVMKNMNELNMGLGVLMDDLKRFEEQNQNDYLNLLKVKSQNKKIELEGKSKMKTLKNLKEYRSQRPKQ